RWYELRNVPLCLVCSAPDPPWFIYQQGTYAPDGNDRWLGSIAMDNGSDIALGFDVSSASVFPSIHYVGRRDSDPLGQLPVGETSLKDGGGVQIGFPLDPNGNLNIFFGDYSQMTVDPNDDCTFWYTNTYYPHTVSPDNWHT